MRDENSKRLATPSDTPKLEITLIIRVTPSHLSGGPLTNSCRGPGGMDARPGRGRTRITPHHHRIQA